MSAVKVRTFLDTCVLLTAWKGREPFARKAIAIMEDGNRSFVASSALKLELLPLPRYHQRQDEVDFYEAYFRNVSIWQEINESLLQRALVVAARYGLHAMDGLHLATAESQRVEEFVTDEKPTKPIFRVKAPRIIALSDL